MMNFSRNLVDNERDHLIFEGEYTRLGRAIEGKRVAIVHDQLYTVGGAEKVLKHIISMIPNADVYALFDLLSDEDRAYISGGRGINTTIMQRLPFLRRLRKIYFPLMPFSIEQLDLGEYDILISSSYLVAKGVITAPDQLHVCYLHSPMRYVWDQQTNYVDQFPSRFGVRRMLVRMLLHYIRGWDAHSSNGVDLLLANSHFVARRTLKAYRRSAEVLHPPVEIERFARTPERPVEETRFVTMSRLAEGKRVHLLVEAFRELPDCRLEVIGDGPMRDQLQAAAPPNVTFRGRLSDEDVLEAYAGAGGFVYAAEEDFGIAPVEAQAGGLPVVAPSRGGTAETVRDFRRGESEPTGVLFDAPTPAAIAEAVRLLRANRAAFTREACRANVGRFDLETFRRGFAAALVNLIAAHEDEPAWRPAARPRQARPAAVAAAGH